MNLDVLLWTDVSSFLAEFYGAGIVSKQVAAIIALGVGGFGVSQLLIAFRK